MIALLALLAAAPAPAQEAPAEVASRYLSLGHWAYPYVDLLVARGTLDGLAPLVQPYRRADLAAAVARARDSAQASAAEREWLDLLAEELAPEMRAREPADPGAAGRDDPGTARFTARARAGTWAVTHTHRDPLRAEGKATLLPFLEGDLAGEAPHVAAVLRFRWDEQFLNDPQFPDGIVVEEHPRFLGLLDFAGRAEEAYLSLQWRYLQLTAGRTYRNWGLPGTGGLLVSAYPYSYDQVAYRAGTDRVALTGFVAQLDEFPGSVKRWLSAHRVDWRIRENLSVALAEAVVYGGENRSFDFRLSNPLNLWLVGGFGQDFVEGPNSSNNLTEVALWWRPTRGLVTYLSLMADEFPGGGTPLEHAAALGLQFPRVGDRLALRLDYSQVATLTYRTTRDYERYAFRDVGLGRDLSDHDLTSLRLDWIPRPGLALAPQLHLLRRGEGDFRQPWPAGQVSEDGPVLFTGEVETTLRVAVAGQWRALGRGTVEWDAGGNFIWDAGHAEGRDVTRFAGRLRVSLETP